MQRIPEILVGFDQADDAGVYRLTDKLALVQTVDFFSPIVDDPFAFGQIAAVNALSDIYAMGGTPLTALSIVGFPEGVAGPGVLREIIEGGLDKLNECEVALLGGHSVKDEEIKFGYAVTGTVDPARILQNSAARVGDRVLLTKRLGTGLIATASKRDRAEAAHVAGAVRSMLETNRKAAELVSGFDVRAMTDIWTVMAIYAAPMVVYAIAVEIWEARRGRGRREWLAPAELINANGTVSACSEEEEEAALRQRWGS